MKPSTELALGRARGRVPEALLPALVRARARIAWRNPKVREDARTQMRFLLEAVRPDADVDAAARRYVERQCWRGELRWHPHLITDQPSEGLEHLTAARDLGRGVVLSFMHHGNFEGAIATMGRRGVQVHVVGFPQLLEASAPGWMQQHAAVAQSQGAIGVTTDVGAEALAKILLDGGILCIATDVPGRTPMRFVGRDLVGSFGAFRLSMGTGAPVVVMTSELRDGRPAIRFHPHFDPQSFPSPQKLLEAVLAVHEPAVLRWPELCDIPTSHWGVPAGTDAGAGG